MHGEMPAEPLWTLDDVTLAPARLRGIWLQISRGVTAVLGWSGAGKTSLLNLLVGFEKPSSGSIHFSNPGTELMWVPQNGGLWPHCTVREHLALVRPDSDSTILLDTFDLRHREAARPDELSQGERSRLSIARALHS